MPKKGKVNKLARMSDEERARYLQHRADVEEEARRRKRELVARFIKNKLDKEEQFAKINTAKINQEWRYILRKIKCKQMALDIQGMLSSFNFLLERKNRLLNFLMRSTTDSDDQHRRAFQAHTETLSYFLKIGSQRLDKLQSAYELQKNNFLDTWDKEEMDITDNQDRAEFKLTLVKYIQDSDFQTYKKEKEIERATKKNDARLEHLLHKHSFVSIRYANRFGRNELFGGRINKNNFGLRKDAVALILFADRTVRPTSFLLLVRVGMFERANSE
ncbi:jg11263 [Pararge aegeria aegeria]|uniref:Dynein regulatory complex subunit 2 n=1 Tax=Pararge aegeria aegeria TaxID=348720 RepID=A0A8S4RMK0_9NEOP|nr:jg11263 [Pararge aegeria aegeria]